MTKSAKKQSLVQIAAFGKKGLIAAVSRGRNEGRLLGLTPQFSNGFKLNDGFWHPYDTRSTFDASSRPRE